jgi:hypothetical protein
MGRDSVTAAQSYGRHRGPVPKPWYSRCIRFDAGQLLQYN